MGLSEHILEGCEHCIFFQGRWRPCDAHYGMDTRLATLGLALETAAAMEITRRSYYRKGWENAMAIRGICEPLEEAHAAKIFAL